MPDLHLVEGELEVVDDIFRDTRFAYRKRERALTLALKEPGCFPTVSEELHTVTQVLQVLDDLIVRIDVMRG